MAQSEGRQPNLGRSVQPSPVGWENFRFISGTTLQERCVSAWKEELKTPGVLQWKSNRRNIYSFLSFLLGSQQGHWSRPSLKGEKQPVLHMARREVARHM